MNGTFSLPTTVITSTTANNDIDNYIVDDDVDGKKKIHQSENISQENKEKIIL